MRSVTVEEVLTLAVRAYRCDQPNLANNLYVVAELMSDSGDSHSRTIAELFQGEIEESIGRMDRAIDRIADEGADRGSKLGIGVAAGMVS